MERLLRKAKIPAVRPQEREETPIAIAED
jgi:hypothetical protein